MCQRIVHQFRYQSLFVREFQSSGVRGFQTVILLVILLVKYVGMFLQVLCILFVRGLYGLYVVGSLQVMCILLEGSMVWVYGGLSSCIPVVCC